MASDEQILKEADYYLNNDVTVEQASTVLGVSKRTLQLHLQKLADIDPDKFKLVTDKKKNNERQGKIKGGTIGKRGTTWTEELAQQVAKHLVAGEATYRQGESKLGIPKSTLYEMVHKTTLDQKTESLLYRLSQANKRKMTIEQFTEATNNEHIATDIVAKQTTEEKIAGRKKS